MPPSTFSYFLLLLLLPHATVLAAIGERAVCTPDNCLRPVESAGAKGSADCTSYELAVGTPSISSSWSIITVTVTGIETIWTPSISYVIWEPSKTSSTQMTSAIQTGLTQTKSKTDLPKRDILPKGTAGLPTYASSCSQAAYASACSCIGVNATPSPVITIFTTTTTRTIPTATVTSTAIFTREVCGPENNYGFIYDSVSVYTNNPLIDEGGHPHATFKFPGLNHHDCCTGCYAWINGCYSYWMDFDVDFGWCEWEILNTGGNKSTLPAYNIAANETVAPPSPHCPNGNSWVAKTIPGNTHGVGPCAHGWLETAY